MLVRALVLRARQGSCRAPAVFFAKTAKLGSMPIIRPHARGAQAGPMRPRRSLTAAWPAAAGPRPKEVGSFCARVCVCVCFFFHHYALSPFSPSLFLFPVTTGATTCLSCDAGKWSSASSVNCSVCPSGRAASTGAVDCTICSEGSYASSEQAANCMSCAAGQYQDGTGATSCKNCVAGTSQVATAQSSCLPCNAGQFAAAEGSASCSYCGTDLTSYEGSAGCSLCIRAFVDINDGQGSLPECEKCGVSGGLKHAACSDEGTILSQISVDKGYWRTGPSSTDLRACLNPAYCKGGTDAEYQCAAGSEGPYCQLCSRDFYMNIAQECERCDGSGIGRDGLLILGLLLTTVCMVGAIAYSCQKEMPRKAKKRINSLGKIIFVFVQLLCSIPENFGTTFPSPFSSLVGGLGVMTFDVSLEAFVGCLFETSYYTQLIVATLFPVAVVASIALLFTFLTYRAADTAVDYKRILLVSGQGAALLVVYVFVPITSRVIFGIFNCESFDNGSSMLVADYSLSCDDSERTGMVIFAVIMVVIWPIGGPLLFATLLFSQRYKLEGHELKELRIANSKPLPLEEEIIELRDLDTSLDGLRVLFDSYRPTAWFWELLVMSRRLILTGIIVVLPRGSVSQCTIGIFTCGLAALFQQTWHPYIEHLENIVSLLAEINLFVLIYIVLLFSLGAVSLDGSSGITTSVLLVVLAIIVISSGIALMVITTLYPPERDGLETGATVVAKSAQKTLVRSSTGLASGGGNEGRAVSTSDDVSMNYQNWQKHKRESSFSGGVSRQESESNIELGLVGTLDRDSILSGRDRGAAEEPLEEEEQEHDLRKSKHVQRLSSHFRSNVLASAIMGNSKRTSEANPISQNTAEFRDLPSSSTF